MKEKAGAVISPDKQRMEVETQMPLHEFTIEFYKGQIGPNNNDDRLSELMSQLAQPQRCPPVANGRSHYEIRHLTILGGGAKFQGVFSKLRHHDLPHAGTPGGDERELPINDDEGLIEKCFFIYYRDYELLVIQRNNHAGTAQRLAEYLTNFSGGRVIVFHPILELDTIRRLMRDGIRVKLLKVSFARPTNPELYQRDTWDDKIMALMSETGGANIVLEIRGDARSRDQDRRLLSIDNIRSIARNFLDKEETKSIHLNIVGEDNMVHPLDLLNGRLKSRRSIEMTGRYPDPILMFNALEAARNDRDDELQAIFEIQ